MTNEEIAREIENDIVYRGNQPVYYMAVREAALKMAEWKDQQFKEYLEKKKEELEYKVVYGAGSYYTKQIDILNEIINELFGGE